MTICIVHFTRYREKDSRMPNWIELPVNPPNARKIQIHNLAAGTTYEFQVPHFSSPCFLYFFLLHLAFLFMASFLREVTFFSFFFFFFFSQFYFQIIGINEYGDGMMSQIVEARTKGKVANHCPSWNCTIFQILMNCWLYLKAHCQPHQKIKSNDPLNLQKKKKIISISL